MGIVSQKLVWLPFYLGLVVVALRLFGWRETLLLVAIVGLVILVADQTASGLLKPMLQRLRPCHDPSLEGMVHVVNGKCGGQYGFVSSHAANFFGLATIFGKVLWSRLRGVSILLIVVAVLVSYSRVYLGVHFPGDVLGGMLVGMISGLLGIFLFGVLRRRMIFPQTASK